MRPHIDIGTEIEIPERLAVVAYDASAAQVMKYYADHRAVTLSLAVLMPLGLVSLTMFLGALLTRVAPGARRADR